MSQTKTMSQRMKNKNNKVKEQTEDNKSTIEDLSKKCVRFLLTKMHLNVMVKRTDIIQHVFQEKPGKNFDLVMDRASEYLNTIYGLNVEIVDSDRVKKYFISNQLPYAHLIPNETENIQQQKTTITFLVLAHIFMSKNNSTDINLWKFLEEFDIKSKTNCETLGSMKTFITQTLVRQNYIIMEDRGGEHDDGEPKKRFKWGTRAEEIVSKEKILKFVSELNNDQDPKFWSDQYKSAKEQFAGCDPN